MAVSSKYKVQAWLFLRTLEIHCLDIHSAGLGGLDGDILMGW